LIPNKVQKGNRPKIEEVISGCLEGELQKSALDFAVYMRENKMSFKLHTSAVRSQRADYGGYEICHMIVNDFSYWSISPKLYNISKYDELAISEGLNNIPWEATRYCVFKDNPDRTDVNASCARCRRTMSRTIFGVEYKGLCHHYWPTFVNPDEETVKSLKRLLELEKMER